MLKCIVDKATENHIYLLNRYSLHAINLLIKTALFGILADCKRRRPPVC